MAAEPKPTGVVGQRVLENLRRLRRGVSTTELSQRLDRIGWPIRANGITRIEGGNRRVDADDLLALSVALGISPARLLLPDVPRISTNAVQYGAPLVGNVVADTRDMWAWACGEQPLVQRDPETWEPAGEVSGVEVALFRVQNQPHHYLGGYAHLSTDPLGEFGVAMRAALDAGVPAARLREYVDQLVEAADGQNP